MFARMGLSLIVAAALFAMGCGSEKASSEKRTAAKETAGQGTAETGKEADLITVQHILIGFEGSVPGKPITRTRDEAQKLAGEILEKAKSGGDFDALVKEYTDDSAPGIYKMANTGIPADMANQVYSRGAMIPAFGNVGFALKVGEIGMAVYDEQNSPYGWHIIKRVE